MKCKVTGIEYALEPSLDGYDVMTSKGCVGHVRKFERRYNLRRVILIRGWRASASDGTKLWSGDGYTASTRVLAIAALLRKAHDL